MILDVINATLCRTNHLENYSLVVILVFLVGFLSGVLVAPHLSRHNFCLLCRAFLLAEDSDYSESNLSRNRQPPPAITSAERNLDLSPSRLEQRSAFSARLRQYHVNA